MSDAIKLMDRQAIHDIILKALEKEYLNTIWLKNKKKIVAITVELRLDLNYVKINIGIKTEDGEWHLLTDELIKEYFKL